MLWAGGLRQCDNPGRIASHEMCDDTGDIGHHLESHCSVIGWSSGLMIFRNFECVVTSSTTLNGRYFTLQSQRTMELAQVPRQPRRSCWAGYTYRYLQISSDIAISSVILAMPQPLIILCGTCPSRGSRALRRRNRVSNTHSVKISWVEPVNWYLRRALETRDR